MKCYHARILNTCFLELRRQTRALEQVETQEPPLATLFT